MLLSIFKFCSEVGIISCAPAPLPSRPPWSGRELGAVGIWVFPVRDAAAPAAFGRRDEITAPPLISLAAMTPARVHTRGAGRLPRALEGKMRPNGISHRRGGTGWARPSLGDSGKAVSLRQQALPGVPRDPGQPRPWNSLRDAREGDPSQAREQRPQPDVNLELFGTGKGTRRAHSHLLPASEG